MLEELENTAIKEPEVGAKMSGSAPRLQVAIFGINHYQIHEGKLPERS